MNRNPKQVYRAFKVLIEEIPMDGLFDLSNLIRLAVEDELISEKMADKLSLMATDRSAYVDVDDLFD